MSYPNHRQPSLFARALVPLGVVILMAVGAAIYLFYLQAGAPKTLSNPLNAPTSAPAPAHAGIDIPALTPAVSGSTTSILDTTADPSKIIPKTGHKTNDEVLADAINLPVEGLANLMVREEFSRKLAIGIYGLSEGRVLNQNRPLVAPEGAFAIVKSGDELRGEYTISPQNASRYDAYVTALTALDSAAAVAVYERSYPVLQAAFTELGMGRRSFHQTVILAIDNLLAAPDATGDIKLIRPKIKYVFLDPELEKLSATHKMMLRLGTAHNQTVKHHLRGLRQKLVDLNL